MAMAFHAEKPIRLRGNNFFVIIKRITASGSYVALGDVLSLKTLNVTTKKPVMVWVLGEAGTIYTYDILNEKVRIWTNAAGGVNLPLVEHTAAALAAGITGDKIYVVAIFN